MSGAFGALGGDLSAININPASGAVFLNNHGAVTFNVDHLRQPLKTKKLKKDEILFG